MKNILRTKRGGFTLIESLAVIAIIGILAAIGAFLFITAQAQARDSVRKSDLNQISEAFSARQLDKTCTDQSVVGIYPGISLEAKSNGSGNAWIDVTKLQSYSDGCGTFTQYLPTIPSDPGHKGATYYFNLATTPTLGSHFRLTAALERPLNTTDQNTCKDNSQIWTTDFGGSPYDCVQDVLPDFTYNYYTGQ